MRLAYAIAALFGAHYAALAGDALRRDGDLAWQRWLGEIVLRSHHLPSALGAETFAAAGSAWVPQEWIFGTVLALSLRAHVFTLFALGVAFAASAALAAIAWRAHLRGASIPAIVVVVLLAGVAMEQMFGVRAQVAVWPLLALFLIALERPGRGNYAAVAIVALWANLHASAMLAPALATLWAIGVALDFGVGSANALRAAVVAAGCALATFATPFGARLPLYAFALLHSPIRHAILEWRAPHLTDLSFGFGVVPLAFGVFALAVVKRHLTWRDALLCCAAVALALQAVRNMPLAAIVLAPVLAQLLTSLLPERPRLAALLRERGVALVGAIAVVAGAGAIAWQTVRLERVAPSRLPVREVARAATLPGARRLYCEDFAWCSLALAHVNLHTFIDGRCDPFPPRLWSAYLEVQSAASRRFGDLARYRIDTIIAARSGALARALRDRRGWRVVLADARFVLFARE
ncbi:MAG TPA: hypothetical protein VNF68_07015 [Candidatus Baltobacteraceae bacterium]|nr:hypothetical protein [Candidatus Baltobacteraceae bacterium]